MGCLILGVCAGCLSLGMLGSRTWYVGEVDGLFNIGLVRPMPVCRDLGGCFLVTVGGLFNNGFVGYLYGSFARFGWWSWHLWYCGRAIYAVRLYFIGRYVGYIFWGESTAWRMFAQHVDLASRYCHSVSMDERMGCSIVPLWVALAFATGYQHSEWTISWAVQLLFYDITLIKQSDGVSNTALLHLLTSTAVPYAKTPWAPYTLRQIPGP